MEKFKVGDRVKYIGRFISGWVPEPFYIVSRVEEDRIWTADGWFDINSIKKVRNVSKKRAICLKIREMEKRHKYFLKCKKINSFLLNLE